MMVTECHIIYLPIYPCSIRTFSYFGGSTHIFTKYSYSLFYIVGTSSTCLWCVIGPAGILRDGPLIGCLILRHVGPVPIADRQSGSPTGPQIRYILIPRLRQQIYVISK